MNQREAKMNLQRLKDYKAQLERELIALQQKIAGVDDSIRIMEGSENTVAAQSSQKKRVPIKRAVLSYLEEAKSNGLNADDAVEKSGGKFERASVSSLLSRLKGDGIATLVGDRYYLIAFAPKASATQMPIGSILN